MNDLPKAERVMWAIIQTIFIAIAVIGTIVIASIIINA